MERISDVCYCMWVWFMRGLKGTEGFLALWKGCYLFPLNKGIEENSCSVLKRKWFTFSCLGASDAPWKPVQSLFTLHSIGHPGDISICFTASWTAPYGLSGSSLTWVPWLQDAPFPSLGASTLSQADCWMSDSMVDLEFSWCIPEDEAGDKILTWHHLLCFSGFNSASKWSCSMQIADAGCPTPKWNDSCLTWAFCGLSVCICV